MKVSKFILALVIGQSATSAFSASLEESSIDHIFSGEIDEVNTKKIKGGLHTVSALNKFKAQYLAKYGADSLDAMTEEEILFGPKTVKLPPEAFNSNARKSMKRFKKYNPSYEIGTKTLFPENWDDQDVLDAIESIIESNEWSCIGNEVRSGFYGGVYIYVAAIDGKVITAYPFFDQEEGKKYEAYSIKHPIDIQELYKLGRIK